MAERDPGPGYRAVVVGEVIRTGDQMFNDFGEWVEVPPSNDGILRHSGHLAMRRKKEVTTPDPGPGYRLLDKGETILAGDEFMNISRTDPRWKVTTRAGLAHRSTTGNQFYRRKVIGPGFIEVLAGECMVLGDETFNPFERAWDPVSTHNVGKPRGQTQWITRRRLSKASHTTTESKEDTSMTHAFGDPEALERQATMLLERAERARIDIDRFGTNEDWEVGNIIIFSKRYSPDPDGQVFTYAALRHAGGWAVTGQGSLTYSTIQKVVQFARESNEIDPGFSRVTEVEEF